MDQSEVKKSIEEHFNLVQQKREVEDQIFRNTTETAELLAKTAQFDLLSVNWARAARVYRHLT